MGDTDENELCFRTRFSVSNQRVFAFVVLDFKENAADQGHLQTMLSWA